MKGFGWSLATVISVVVFASLSSFWVSSKFDSLYEDVLCSNNIEEIDEVGDDFRRCEGWLSIFIDDSSLLEIENSFCGMDILLKQGDKNAFEMEKSRLLELLSQQRRLSGFTLRSIM